MKEAIDEFLRVEDLAFWASAVVACRITASQVPNMFKFEVAVKGRGKLVVEYVEKFTIAWEGVECRRDKAPRTHHEKKLSDQIDLLNKRAKS